MLLFSNEQLNFGESPQSYLSSVNQSNESQGLVMLCLMLMGWLAFSTSDIFGMYETKKKFIGVPKISKVTNTCVLKLTKTCNRVNARWILTIKIKKYFFDVDREYSLGTSVSRNYLLTVLLK